jgi:thiol-disulfide isomerase/thioredoxin
MNYIIIAILILVCIIIAYFIYTNYVKIDPNKFSPNNENKSIASVKEGSLILFYATWCPHSKIALDKWKSIKQKYTSKIYTITFSELDCDKYASTANKYNVTEYPTIILVKNDKKYIYDAELDSGTLELFINTVMNE